MTDTSVQQQQQQQQQQQIDTNGQALVTETERATLMEKLFRSTKWPLELLTQIENTAYEKSHGIKPVYLKFVQNYYQKVQNDRRANQQQQLMNNNATFANQQINLSQSMLSQPTHQLTPMLNQQPRFPSGPQQQQQPQQQQFQSRMTNPQQSILNTQQARLREPQKFNQQPLNPISYTSSTPPSIQTIDLPQSYSSQQQINPSNPNDYLSQTAAINKIRYPIQQSINPRARLTNGNFSQQSSSNNSNDILHQIVVGNSSTANAIATPITINTNTSSASSGDRLLQQILLSHNDGTSNKVPIQNRQQSTGSIMTLPIRSASTTNNNNNTNPLRSLLTSHQSLPSPSVIVIPTSTVQIQPLNNVTIQQSPLNNSNGPFSANPQSVPQQPSMIMNSSTPLMNNNSSPNTRTLMSIGSGSISSPDDETRNLIKYLKENIGKLQSFSQKFTNDGNLDKARNVQAIHQQMIQFISNPTYESLTNAKHIRDMLERASNRSQLLNIPTTNPTVPPSVISQAEDLNQFGKAFTDFISRDQKKRMVLSKLFVEPLSDVLNGVPHKKIRLDVDNCSKRIISTKIYSSNHSSLISRLNDELNRLPANTFSIEIIQVSHTVKNTEINDEYLSKNGLVLRCTFIETLNPCLRPLRLQISIRYPDEQPIILSLTNTMPPKLEFTDGHPFFEQTSMLFVSHLFKLPSQHTVTDILNIWRQSVQTAL